jgi:hypothetical protein
MDSVPDLLQVVTSTPVNRHRPFHLLFVEADEDRPLTLREGVICGFRSKAQIRSYLTTVSDTQFKNARAPKRADHYPFEPWQCMRTLQGRTFDKPGAHRDLFWTATFGLIAMRYLGLELPRKYSRSLHACADILTFETSVRAWIGPTEGGIEQIVRAFALMGASVYASIEMVDEGK